jgi:hypothetical protein
VVASATAIDAAEGRELIDQLGFLHVPGPPLARGKAYLIVGLRRVPTLNHFDPERIDYWVTQERHGTPASIDWPTRVPELSEFSWGTIHIVDRLGVSNEFLAFGGKLEVRRIEEVKVAVFSSDAPIVARGGHSQTWERGSHEITAYLAKLRAAADPRGDVERRLARLSPVARYAAFIRSSLVVVSETERRAGWSRADTAILARERRRLQQDWTDDWAAGGILCAWLGAAPYDPAGPS